MRQIHYISGLTITIFITFHLSNHLCSLAGVKEHIEIMDKFRTVYRNGFVETILLCAVLIQIISGIRLFLNRKATSFFERLQRWSGLYLALFLVFHLGAVFTGRLILNLDTNIYFGVAGLNTFPYNLFFIPYYGLAIVSFFGHISALHAIKMKHHILRIKPDNQAYIILGIGITLSLVTLYGLTNAFHGIEIPKEYNIMIGK